MERRGTRIPRPPPLKPLTDNEVNGRKRKAAQSPQSKEGVIVKRSAGAAAPAQGEPTWAEVAAEGETPEDCLGQKLSIKKRESAAIIKDVTLSYIKRLRALGWHLHGQAESLQMDNSALRSALDSEARARVQDASDSSSILADLKRSMDRMQEELAEQRDLFRQEAGQAATLRADLATTKQAHSEATKAVAAMEAGAARATEQIADLTKQVAGANELHQHATKYCSTLQEYNTKLQEEVQTITEQLRAAQARPCHTLPFLIEEKNRSTEEAATLRGTAVALETQLAAAQATHTSTETAREHAHADASTLRTDLERVTMERGRLAGALQGAQQELARYREATGQSAEDLQVERAGKAALESRTRAQAEVSKGLAEQLEIARELQRIAETLAAARGAECAALRARVAEAEAARAAAEEKAAAGEALRRNLHNTILTLKGNIRVFCRVRPAGTDGAPEVERLENGQPVLALPSAEDDTGLELVTPNGNHSTFTFDQVFGPGASQAEVFEEVSLLVQSALDGYKVCVFAYGQTGSGKTHTMLGCAKDPGLIPRAVDQLFADARALEASQGWRFEMTASMLEIYMEEIKDLLGKGPPAGKKHTVSHDDKTGTTSVSFLDTIDCVEPGRVRELLARAGRARTVGATAANERSSRSHLVFLLHVRGTHAATGQTRHGQLNLIDLAGSERLKVSGVSGERLKETQAINKSLSALATGFLDDATGDVIAALGSREAAHVPYRNSKLTWLLQPCLGGDAKMLMIANVAGTAAAANESLCSLRFAAKVNATDIGVARRTTGVAK